MKQTTFATTGFELVTKRTRKDEFLEEMSPIVLWSELLAMIQTFAPANKTRRPPFPTFTLLRLTYMQQWFGLSDPAMEEAFYDMVLFRELAQLDPGLMLNADTEVGDTLIAAPSSAKISTRKSDPEMHQAQKGNRWRFGMKVLICAASESGLVHTAPGTVANKHDITLNHALLHGKEDIEIADYCCRGITKREEIQAQYTTVDSQVGGQPELVLVGSKLIQRLQGCSSLNAVAFS